MGGVLSSSKAFREALEASNLGTPKKEQRKLPAEFDPRSPSTELSRTPIVVEATPTRAPATNDFCLTPINQQTVGKLDLDPRSPSTEITRTPIQIVAQVVDPRSPTTEVCRTPIIAQDEVNVPAECRDEINEAPVVEGSLSDSIPNIDAIPPIPALDMEEDVINRSLSEPDLSKDDIALIRRRNVPSSDAFRESTPKIKNKKMRQGHSTDDINTKSTKVKDRTQLRMKDNQRSPLALRMNVDVNSPRVIVQRKQMTKLSMSMKVPKVHMDSPQTCIPRSPSKYQSLEPADKENMMEY